MKSFIFDPSLFYYKAKNKEMAEREKQYRALMVKPHRNQKRRENPIKKWWCYCGKSVNKRFEDLIQTIANGEEGCGDDETKWKRMVSNKGKYEANLYLLHCRTQRIWVITGRIEEVVISLCFKEMNEFWIIRSIEVDRVGVVVSECATNYNHLISRFSTTLL